MSELFNYIPVPIADTNPDDYKNKIWVMLTYIWNQENINKIRYKTYPLKRPILSKKSQEHKDNIKENLRKATENWNHCKFQIIWNKLERFDSKGYNKKQPPFFTSLVRFIYIIIIWNFIGLEIQKRNQLMLMNYSIKIIQQWIGFNFKCQ